MTVTVGVDVGGTSIRARLFDDGTSTKVEDLTSAAGGEQVAERIHETVVRLLDGTDVQRLAGVGVGVPGLVDIAAGTVRHAVNLGIDGTPFPLRDRLATALETDVAVENDVRAAALGVHHHLRTIGREVADLVYLSLGTGISAGIIIGGRLHRGRHGSAGEIGHAPLAGEAVGCRCGLRGCLEAVAGGRAITDSVGTSARRLFSAQAPAPEAATTVASAVARALHVLAMTYDPDLFVLGGGIGPHAAPAVRSHLIELSRHSPFGEALLSPDRVLTLPPDIDVGTTGAALLTHTHTTSERPDLPKGGNRP